MKLLSPEVALYLYKSTYRLCMKYCCHFRTCVPRCYLQMFDKLQKQIRRTVGSSFPASLESLAHCPNVFSIFITLVDVHLKIYHMMPLVT